MLKIKQKFHLSLPHIPLTSPRPLQFAPVEDDDDELTQAIVTEPVQHDNQWQLSERPDEKRLEAFWTRVEDDILHDPTWINFSEEET
jgi:hypothetical protein